MEKQFLQIIHHKSNIAPIAEKACKNFELKSVKNISNEHLIKERIHYFAIGHSFKNIDTKTAFDFITDIEGKSQIPNRFLNLQKDSFSFSSDLGKLLKSIRNINGHFIH